MPTENFLPGSIRRIKCENFLTYRFVEVFPTNRLNVIVGPNGSGKSTIICAICIGLCGSPRVLGRSTALGDYIQRGHNKGHAEIELQARESNQVIVIRRVLNRTTANEVFVNGKKTTVEEVQKVVKQFHIQVDNLCQFLAQDNVVKFSCQGPTELLRNTEKVISSDECNFTEMHEQLIGQSSNRAVLEADQRRQEVSLTDRRRRLEQLQPDVERLQMKRRLQHELKVLGALQKFVAYADKRTEFMAASTDAKQATIAFDKKEQEMKPIKDEITRTERTAAQLQSEANADKAEATKLRKAGLDKLKQTMNRLMEELSNKREELHRREQEFHTRRTAISGLQERIGKDEEELARQDANAEDLKPQIDAIAVEIAAVYEQIHGSDPRLNEMRQRLADLEHQEKSLDSRLNQMRSQTTVIYRAVNAVNRDAAEAMKWLDENRHRFQGEVIGPIAAHIKLRSPNYARYLENVVATRDLFAFVCDNHEDTKTFLNHVRDELNLSVPCMTVGEVDPQRIADPTPLGRRYKNLGFERWLDDLFDAPDLVRKFLRINNRVHTIPVGNARTDERLQEVNEQFGMSLPFYLTASQLISVSRSRYANKTMTQINPLREPKFLPRLATNDNSEAVGETERLLHKVQQSKVELTEETEALRKEQGALNVKQQELQHKKLELMRQTQSRAKREADLQQKKERLRRLQAQPIDMEGAKKQLRKCKIQLVHIVGSQMSKTTNGLQLLGEDYKGVHVDAGRKSLQSARELAVVRSLKLQTTNLQTQLGNLSLLRNQAMEKRNQLKTEAHALLQEAREECQIDPKTNRPSDEMMREFDKYKSAPTEEEDDDSDEENERPSTSAQSRHEWDRDHLETEAERVRQRLDALAGGNDDAMREYEECQQRVAELERTLADVTSRLENFQERLDKSKDEWLVPLRAKIEEINANFNKFFRAMKCAGEVSISTPDNPNDFSNYGIGLRVAFRENEHLQQLTAQRQSGGERSVSTILFMLALQELSRVPFRCVDEINQGMDDANERRVFSLMVDLLCGEENSGMSATQYFMLTPKLLEGLPWAKRLCVLIVCNGPTIAPRESFNLDDILKRKKELKNGERRVKREKAE